MVFGEIVEPSTRALIDDDFEEYPEYVNPQLSWEGDATIPATIDSLIFIESNKITRLFQALTLNSEEVLCSLNNGGIQIYKLLNDKYVISYIPKDLTTGEIIEALQEWLKKASHIHAVTSEPVSAYQNTDSSEKPETFIRKLSSSSSSAFNCRKLESPNLVSGLGAEVLSFCIHSDLKSTLYVVYMDNSPLDSVNINPVVQLMKSLDLSVRSAPLHLNATPSNLYL